MENLPPELINRIFEELEPNELMTAGATNRRLYASSRDEPLWRRRVEEELGPVPKIADSWFQTYRHTLRRVYVAKYIDDDGTCEIIGIYTKKGDKMIDGIMDYLENNINSIDRVDGDGNVILPDIDIDYATPDNDPDWDRHWYMFRQYIKRSIFEDDIFDTNLYTISVHWFPLNYD